MFASTLNRITASVRCVSSIIVVLNAKFAQLIVVRGNKQARQKCYFLLVETHVHLTSITVLTVHAKTSLLYTFQRSIKANRNINLWKEKAPIYRLSRSKAPKTQQVCHYKHTRKTSELFLLFNTGVDFNLRNNFDNSSSFAKVSVPVHIYNSLVDRIG